MSCACYCHQPRDLQASGTSCEVPVSLKMGINNVIAKITPVTIDLGPCTDACAFSTMYKVNYYSFTPPTDGYYYFDTCNNTNFDTKLLVQRVCDDVSTSSVIACNDDGPECLWNRFGAVTPSAYMEAGTRYFVLLGAYAANTAPGKVSIIVYQTSSGRQVSMKNHMETSSFPFRVQYQ